MNLTKRITAWFLTLVMVLGLIPQTMFAQEIATSPLQYEATQEMNEDKTEATISIKFTETETIQLEKVTLPDGTEKVEDLSEVTYTVSKNGKYDFKVYYSMDGAEQEETIPVEITELEKKKAEETPVGEYLTLAKNDSSLLKVNENTYEVSTADELKNVLEQIKNSQDTEATIVLSSNIDSSVEFSGVQEKTITLQSKADNKHSFNLAKQIQGNIILENVRLVEKETDIYANGHRFETANTFEGEITNIYGGGDETTEVNGDTYLVLRGGIFRSIYGGGYNSTVNGNTHVIFDGATIKLGMFGSNQRIIGGGYGDAPNKGIVNGNTDVKIISGILGVTNSTINGNQDNGCGIYAGGFNNSKSDFSTSAMVTGNTNLEFGGKNDGDIIVGEENAYVRDANYAAGSYRSTILGDANLTLKEGSRMAYVDKYGNMNTPTLYGGGLEDHIKGTVHINVTGGNNMQWRDSFGEIKARQDGIDLYLGGKIKKDYAVNKNGPTIENENNEPYTVIFNMTGGALASVYATGNVSPFYSNSKHTEITGDVKLNISGSSTVVAEIHGSYGGNIEESNQLSKSEITVSNGAQFRSVLDSEKLILNQLGTKEKEAPIKSLQRINNVSIENSYIHIGYKAWYEGATNKTECMPWVKNLSLRSSVLHTDDNAITTIKNHKINDSTGALNADLGATVTMEDSIWEADEVIEIYGSMNMNNSKLILKNNSMGGYVLANFNTVKENFHSENSELYLNTVDPQNGNYDNNEDKDPTKVIRLQINGKATGNCKVYTVQEGQGTKLEKPEVGGNYIIANTQSDFNTFQLANEDAIEDGLGFVKKYGRIKTTTGGSGISKKFATMWQIGTLPLPKYDIKYTFKSLDDNIQLPESVNQLKPQDEIDAAVKGSTVNAPSTKFDDVKVTDGVWKFKGWTPAKHENVTGNVEFVGTWEFKKNEYRVTYDFVSGTRGKNLPPEITSLLPTDSTKYYEGDTITAKNPTQLEFEVSDGVWKFEKYDANSKIANAGNVNEDGYIQFTGTWIFETKKYVVSYKFESTNTDKELPKEIIDQLPTAGSVEHGKTVNAPSTKFDDVKVTDGVWSFKGWTPVKYENVTGNVEFVGKWEFKKNASIINHIPTISASDKTLTVGDTFDPLKDVTATDKEDGDLTKEIEILKNEVNTSKAGVYEVTYKVTDSKGASSIKTIKVTVIEKNIPIIPNEPDKPNKPDTNKPEDNGSVGTGDKTNGVFWTMLSIICGISVIGVYRKKREINQ